MASNSDWLSSRTLAVFAGIALSWFSGPASADAYSYYPNSPIHLGSTLDPRKMTTGFLPCISFQNRVQLNAYDNSSALGMETQYTVDQLKTRKQLYNYLHVSASVSGHYKFFSGGASYDLEQESTFDSDSFSWIIRGYTKYGEFGMDQSVALTPPAQALINNPVAFRARCGTEFVVQESRSVLIAAVYTLKNESSSNWKKVTASFKASIDAGIWGVDGKAKYEEFFKEAVSSGQLSFRLYVIGGEGISALSDIALVTGDIEKVKELIAEYTRKLTIKYSVPTDFLTGSLAQFSPNLATYDFGLYNQFIEEAYLQVAELQARHERLMSVLNRGDDYDLTESQFKELQGHVDGIQDVINTVRSRAIACKKLHDGAVASIPANQAKIDKTCVVDSSLAYTAKVNWPTPQPFQFDYWTDDLIHAPQVFIYVDVRGTRIREVRILNSRDEVKKVLPVNREGAVRRAFGAIEFNTIADPEKPLKAKVITDSGNEYFRELLYTPSVPPVAAIPAPILSPGIATAPAPPGLKSLVTPSPISRLGALPPRSAAQIVEDALREDAADSVSVLQQTNDLRAVESVSSVSELKLPQQQLTPDPKCSGQDKFCVRRSTMSLTCRVQAATEMPIGNGFMGPYDSRAAATAAMCKNRDPDKADSSKCWEVAPDTACN